MGFVRSWLSRYGGGSIPYEHAGPATSGPVSHEASLDRYERHTKYCPHCQQVRMAMPVTSHVCAGPSAVVVITNGVGHHRSADHAITAWNKLESMRMQPLLMPQSAVSCINLLRSITSFSTSYGLKYSDLPGVCVQAVRRIDAAAALLYVASLALLLVAAVGRPPSLSQLAVSPPVLLAAACAAGRQVLLSFRTRYFQRRVVLDCSNRRSLRVACNRMHDAVPPPAPVCTHERACSTGRQQPGTCQAYPRPLLLSRWRLLHAHP